MPSSVESLRTDPRFENTVAKHATNTPDTMSEAFLFIPIVRESVLVDSEMAPHFENRAGDAEQVVTFSETDEPGLSEAKGKKKKKHAPEKPGKDADVDDWVRYYLEKFHGRHVSKAETILTVASTVAAIAVIAYFGWAYWPVIGVPVLAFISNFMKSRIGITLFGFIGSWLKGKIQKIAVKMFKGVFDKWAKEIEARKRAKQILKEEKKIKKTEGAEAPRPRTA